jgi:hypothetical protein
MGRISKSLALIFILVIAISCLMMFTVLNAQTPKPSAPEFTIKYVDNSYNIPPTYGIDQYTGQNVTIKAGQHVDSRNIEFTIKNQPFKPYTDTNGNHITLYYSFRFKGAYGNDWSNYPDTSHTYGVYTGLFPDTSASNSEYTVIMISLPALTNYPKGTPEIPTGAKLDFQVRAIMGNISIESIGWLAGGSYGYNGQFSDWSNTQTVTITNGATSTSISASDSPNPTPTLTPNASAITNPTTNPSVPEFPLWTISLLLIVTMASVGLMFYHKKQKQGKLAEFV